MIATPDPNQTHTRDTEDWPAELFELPNDPVLKENTVHETGGLLRAHRALGSGKALREVIGSDPMQLVDQLQLSIDTEADLHRAGVTVYDGPLSREDAAEYLAGC